MMLTQDALRDWTVALLAADASPATVILRQRGVRRFSAWLASKGLISCDEIERFKPPKNDDPIVPALTDAQLRALLATCKGSEFHHVRDRALILFMAETASRAAEVIGMEVPADLNQDAGLAVIRRGKPPRLITETVIRRARPRLPHARISVIFALGRRPVCPSRCYRGGGLRAVS